MGHSGDDVNYKIPHKMKTCWPNQLKISKLVYLKVFYRTRYKKDRCYTKLYLSNAPLIYWVTKHTLANWY